VTDAHVGIVGAGPSLVVSCRAGNGSAAQYNSGPLRRDGNSGRPLNSFGIRADAPRGHWLPQVLAP